MIIQKSDQIAVLYSFSNLSPDKKLIKLLNLYKFYQKNKFASKEVNYKSKLIIQIIKVLISVIHT